MENRTSSVTPTNNLEANLQFYACRPEWLTVEEQEQFKIDHPELVAEYAEYWQQVSEQAVQA